MPQKGKMICVIHLIFRENLEINEKSITFANECMNYCYGWNDKRK